LIKSTTEIENDYENEYNFLLSKCSSVKPLTRRILSKLAIVSLARRYAVEAIGIKVDMQALRDYILELEKNISNEPSPEEILLEAIQRDIIEYGSRYMFNETNKPEKGYGIIFSEYSTTEIYITETSFLRIMAKNNINNWKSTLSELKRKNILIAEKDRLTKRLKLFASMPKQKCYCFRLVDDNNDSTDTNQNPNDELTHLEGKIEGLKNQHVSVYEENDKVTFLYKIEEGPANKSYGINVARLAHLPTNLLERAKDILIELENKKVSGVGSQYLIKEVVKESEIEAKIKEIDPLSMSPMEALNFLYELKKNIK